MPNLFDNYYNLKLEINSLKERIALISMYETSLKKEKEQLKKSIDLQENYLSQIEDDLKQLTGIKNKIYCEIVLNGTTVSKTIEKVAIEEGKDVSTLWKNYYPEVKERINILKLLTNIDNK